MKLLKTCLVFLVVAAAFLNEETAADNDAKATIKRRKKILRRKVQVNNNNQPEEEEIPIKEVIPSQPEVSPVRVETYPVPQQQQVPQTQQQLNERGGRGFLDEFYKQFDRRTLQETKDSSVSEATSVPFAYEVVNPFAPEVVDEGTPRTGAVGSVHVVNPYPPVVYEDLHKQYIQEQEQQEQEQESRQKFSADLTSDTFLSEDPIKRTTFGYVNHGGAPTYSSLGGYSLPPTTTNYIDDSSYTQKELASKYFGVATTTSQDIQLGLTFTVPFLSIPLQSLTGLFNGNGISDLFNFNFDSSNLITLAVIVLGAIFVLPQVIYWLTGVNLSAFNWGRSDDPTFLTELVDKVDSALAKYDIDVRECAASTMCKQLKKTNKDAGRAKNGDEDDAVDTMSSLTLDLISKGIIKTAAKSSALKGFLGEAKVNEIVGVGENPSYQCDRVFKARSCPWHPSTSKSIIAKLILDSDLDLGTIASMAIEGAKAFT